MTTSIEETENTNATPAVEPPKATKRARAGARGAHVAPKKAKSGKKAAPAKRAPKGAKKAAGARDGSKAEKILDLLKRPGGATAQELQKVTGWQPHSVRGVLSGTIRKKRGLAVTSTKGDDGERTYSVKLEPLPFPSQRAAGFTSGVPRFGRCANSADQSDSARHRPCRFRCPAMISASMSTIFRPQRAIHAASF